MFENYPRVGVLANALAGTANDNKPSLYFIGAMKSEGTETRERFEDAWDSIVDQRLKSLG